MKLRKVAGRPPEAGKIGWLLLWFLGVPIPVLVLLLVLRGCA